MIPIRPSAAVFTARDRKFAHAHKGKHSTNEHVNIMKVFLISFLILHLLLEAVLSSSGSQCPEDQILCLNISQELWPSCELCLDDKYSRCPHSDSGLLSRVDAPLLNVSDRQC